MSIFNEVDRTPLPPAAHTGRRAKVATITDTMPMRSRDDVLIYQRQAEAERFTVALNLTHEARRVRLPERGTIVMSTYLDRRNCAVADFLF